MERLWLSVREASEATGLSEWTVRQRAPLRREGRRLLVPLSWVTAGAHDGGVAERAEMGAIEYRVVWQRQGTPRVKERRYLTGRGALRRYALLTSPPHARCTPGNGYDEPPFCVWSRGYEHEEPPPWLVEPRIEVRGVGPWDPMTDDRPHDPRALPDDAVAALCVAMHASCLVRWEQWRMDDPERQFTQHGPDAHEEEADWVVASLRVDGYHLSRHAPDGAADEAMVERVAKALCNAEIVRLVDGPPIDPCEDHLAAARRILGVGDGA